MADYGGDKEEERVHLPGVETKVYKQRGISFPSITRTHHVGMRHIAFLKDFKKFPLPH